MQSKLYFEIFKNHHRITGNAGYQADLHKEIKYIRNLFVYECYYPIVKDADEVLKETIRYLKEQK